MVNIFKFDFFFVSQNLIDRLNLLFGEMKPEELVFYWFLIFDVISFFKCLLVSFIETALCKLEKGTSGGRKSVNGNTLFLVL